MIGLWSVNPHEPIATSSWNDSPPHANETVDYGGWSLALVVALLSSVVPFTLEITALRRLSPAVFGVMMSLSPALAAAAGYVVLGQSLTWVQALAIAMTIAATLGVVLGGRGAKSLR